MMDRTAAATGSFSTAASLAPSRLFRYASRKEPARQPREISAAVAHLAKSAMHGPLFAQLRAQRGCCAGRRWALPRSWNRRGHWYRYLSPQHDRGNAARLACRSRRDRPCRGCVNRGRFPCRDGGRGQSVGTGRYRPSDLGCQGRSRVARPRPSRRWATR